jgi:hypothetical protein
MAIAVLGIDLDKNGCSVASFDETGRHDPARAHDAGGDWREPSGLRDGAGGLLRGPRRRQFYQDQGPRNFIFVGMTSRPVTLTVRSPRRRRLQTEWAIRF